MRRVHLCLLLLTLLPTLAATEPQRPDWLFPVTTKVPPVTNEDPARLWTVPGSTLSITRSQINDIYNVPNWLPDLYPPMPKIVQFGDPEKKVPACGSCHLPTGTGYEDSAYLAGLPVSYFIRQMTDFRSGDRKAPETMVSIARTITEEEIRNAAGYFASLRPRASVSVIEIGTVPKTYIEGGNRRLLHPDGGSEPIGERIIEVPENEENMLNRDPRSGFIAYVPTGSINRGKELVTGKTYSCALCHGETLHGMGDIPALAGRHPAYIVRQLWNFQNGERTGDSSADMRLEVEDLTIEDMLSIAAYLASLPP